MDAEEREKHKLEKAAAMATAADEAASVAFEPRWPSVLLCGKMQTSGGPGRASPEAAEGREGGREQRR